MQVNIDSKIYNEFLKTLSIDEVSLFKLNIDNTRNQSENISVYVEYDCNDYEVDKENYKIKAYPNICVSFSDKESEIFKIECKYFLQYSFEEVSDITDEYYKLFIDRTIKNVVWPYFRENISTLTSKMGYPAFLLDVNVGSR